MLRAGWIAEHVTPPEPGAVSRRLRIVYELTTAGDERFRGLMADVGPAAWEDDTFDVRFAFFSRTDMEARLRILEGRRSRLQERLDRVQHQLERTQRQVDRYAMELQRHGVESVEREVRWLSDLINAERRDDQQDPRPVEGPPPPPGAVFPPTAAAAGVPAPASQSPSPVPSATTSVQHTDPSRR
jgi:hypothetical protein